MSWGILLNGVCLTARISESHNSDGGYILSDILIADCCINKLILKNISYPRKQMREPNEPMYTLTTMDRHGVIYNGRVRRLMPKECFRLQGYTDEQFDKLVEIGIPESQLYKMAGNSVTTNVVTAVGWKLISEIQKLEDIA